LVVGREANRRQKTGLERIARREEVREAYDEAARQNQRLFIIKYASYFAAYLTTYFSHL
jgi:outer membrane murein-binding lipoprotein Lpp